MCVPTQIQLNAVKTVEIGPKCAILNCTRQLAVAVE